jgi:hypothetical protein
MPVCLPVPGRPVQSLWARGQPLPQGPAVRRGRRSNSLSCNARQQTKANFPDGQDPMEVGKSRKRIGKRHHPKPREDAVCALIRKIQALRIGFKKAHLGEADQSSTPGQVEGDAGDVDPDDTAIKAHALGQLQTDCPAPQPTSTTTSLSSGDKASIARTPRGDS